MPQELSYPGSSHSAPHRESSHEILTWFAITAAPLAWVTRLLVNYTIAGQHCVGAANIGALALPDEWIATILLVDLLALLLAAIAGSIAYRQWREMRSENGGSVHHLVHSGEGRARFLAMCGMLTSALFGVAVIIDASGRSWGRHADDHYTGFCDFGRVRFPCACSH